MDLLLLGMAVGWLCFMAKTHVLGQKVQPRVIVRSPATVLQITLEGVQRPGGVPDFVSRFGISPAWVSDFVFSTGPVRLQDLPLSTQACLEDVYQRGGTRGPEIPGLLFRGEALPEGKALYLAACTGGGPARVLAFVHDALATG